MPEHSAPRLDREDARQGETSGHMRIVLTVSFIGAVIVLAAVLIWYAKIGQNHLPPSTVAAPSTISQSLH